MTSVFWGKLVKQTEEFRTLMRFSAPKIHNNNVPVKCETIISKHSGKRLANLDVVYIIDPGNYPRAIEYQLIQWKNIKRIVMQKWKGQDITVKETNKNGEGKEMIFVTREQINLDRIKPEKI